eukprot:TRINITY_DN2486_c0_g1_i1.p1 TRINITY_DN2486_c0_g1~~TRINITY_DN2486_c0_g1_i1.p1  ORF type:complete len:333 (-),score=92.44 TRINITY_DN2486_c0_g1_i1:341-1339(-)
MFRPVTIVLLVAALSAVSAQTDEVFPVILSEESAALAQGLDKKHCEATFAPVKQWVSWKECTATCHHDLYLKSYKQYQACYGCCSQKHVDLLPPPKTQFETCNDLHTERPRTSSGFHSLLNQADKKTYQAVCDMDSDGGGWTLASSYDLASGEFKHYYDQGLKAYIHAHISNLEVRNVVVTDSHEYKRFLKNSGVKGKSHDGKTAYQASCKQAWKDNYKGADWGVDTQLGSRLATTHAESAGKGKNSWQYNMVDACTRSLTAADGSKYTAQTNTFYAGWDAHCGGLHLGPKKVYAAGCAVDTHFEKTGPEGETKHRYVANIKGVKRIEIWIK